MNFKITSPLAKVRITDRVEHHPDYTHATALRGDRLYFGGVYDTRGLVRHIGLRADIKVTSPLAPYITVYAVDQVPVRLAHYPNSVDGDYLDHKPGLYPDLLRPASCIYLEEGLSGQLYFELNVPKTAKPGKYTVTVELQPNEAKGDGLQNVWEPLQSSIEIEILPAKIPEQTISYTQWFHYDCLADYYGVPVFSKRHWEITENFVKTAVKMGIDTLLTPIFTPALDTLVKGERPTVQLVDISLDNGTYTFGFEKLKRFCRMCRRSGVRQLELPPLFTQWGAEHAPKIMATVDGEYRRIFGWETGSIDPAYTAFLRTFIPAVRKKLDEYGYKDRYFFHISDEPKTDHLPAYKAARESVWDLISDRPVRDALSQFEFYEQGVVTQPVPTVKTADIFVKNNVPDLWVYYCCSPGAVCSNRFISMTGNRARVIGAQMFRAGVTGFLHWGYNFYYNRFSREMINPFLMTDGDYFTPGGDTFTVYPGPDGKPLQSLRGALFEQALYDMRAMERAAEVSGRETVMAAIDAAGMTDFKHYPTDPNVTLALREKINRMAVK